MSSSSPTRRSLFLTTPFVRNRPGGEKVNPGKGGRWCSIQCDLQLLETESSLSTTLGESKAKRHIKQVDITQSRPTVSF
jgi:hypothetical protein